jgi:transporter family-2 protein
MSAGATILGAAAFIGGMLVAAQGPIYARLSEGLGRDYLVAVFLAFLTATLATGVLVFATGHHRAITVAAISGLPLWAWLGGLLGATHVLISMQAIPVLGVTLFLVIVVTGNLAGAALYDHVGAMGLSPRPMSWVRASGLVLVVLGVAIAARG